MFSVDSMCSRSAYLTAVLTPFSELKKHMWVQKFSWEWDQVLARDRPTHNLGKAAKEGLVQQLPAGIKPNFPNKSFPFPSPRRQSTTLIGGAE